MYSQLAPKQKNYSEDGKTKNGKIGKKNTVVFCENANGYKSDLQRWFGMECDLSYKMRFRFKNVAQVVAQH